MRARSAVLAGLLTAVAFIPAPVRAYGMTDFYNEAGLYANVTGPGAYRGQTMGLFTGGSMFVRAPQRTYQLAGVAGPNLKAGCGGIDLFAGSFSFINEAQFVALLKNIGQNALGYFFQLALKSMAPEIAVTIEWLQDQAQKINALNVNSCQAARSVVDGTVGRYMQADEERARNWRVTLGDFSDRIGSWVNTTTNTQIYDAQARAKSSIPGIQPPAGQGFSNQIPTGNFTWKALSHPALGLNTLQKRQLMTLIGTVIYVPPANDQESPRLIVRPGHHKLLHYIGNVATGEASLEFYRCLDGYGDDQCLQVDLDAAAMYPSFGSIVQDRLRAVANNILARTPQTAADIAFVNVSDLPVYRMMSVAAFSSLPGLSDTLIDTYKDLIAAKYAAAFVKRGIDTVRQAVTVHAANGTAFEDEQLARLDTRMRELEQEVRDEVRSLYQNAAKNTAIAEDLLRMERTLHAHMPSVLSENLKFARPGRP
jgi:conjugative transfer pilus assembly protein TraH